MNYSSFSDQINNDIKNIKKQTNNIYVKNKKPKTIVARINLNLIYTLMFIQMTAKNIFLNKRPVSCLSSKYHLSIDTKSINKQTNIIYLNKQTIKKNCGGNKSKYY